MVIHVVVVCKRLRTLSALQKGLLTRAGLSCCWGVLGTGGWCTAQAPLSQGITQPPNPRGSHHKASLNLLWNKYSAEALCVRMQKSVQWGFKKKAKHADF